MRRRSYELLYAAVAMALIAAGYGVAVRRLASVPAAGSLLGHGLGIAGFVLMLMTETLYSLRKRSRSARWGRNATWLKFHIFTGLVGPFMVLLHTSWKFNGLAGVVALLTGIIVISGFIGRYIYTAVPRTVDGAAVEAAELEAEIAGAESELRRWLADRPETAQALAARMEAFSSAGQGGSSMVLGRVFPDLGYRLRWWRERRQFGALAGGQARELDRLLQRKQILRRQVASLAMARRMLATWHAMHIPIGVTLFTAALIHVGAALYYATLLK